CLFEPLRCRLDQHHSALAAFAAKIKMAVGAGERPLSQFVPLLPDRRAGFEILADPAFAVRIAVEKVAHTNDTAMMIDHDFVRVNLPGVEPRALFRDFEKIAADAIAGGHVNVVAEADRRWNDRSAAV